MEHNAESKVYMKRVFHIDIGVMSKKDAKRILEQIKAKMRDRQYYDFNTGGYVIPKKV